MASLVVKLSMMVGLTYSECVWLASAYKLLFGWVWLDLAQVVPFPTLPFVVSALGVVDEALGTDGKESYTAFALGYWVSVLEDEMLVTLFEIFYLVDILVISFKVASMFPLS